MLKTLLIVMLAITATATAQPYLPVRSYGYGSYGPLVPSAYTSAIVQEAVPTLVQEPLPAVGAVSTVLPGPVSAPFPTATAFTTPDLANYAYGDYSSLYGVPNFRTLASTYPVPQYSYAYGNYVYRR